MTLVIMAVTFVLIGRTSAGKGGYFDAPAGFAQVYHSDALIWTSLACCGSIAFFVLLFLCGQLRTTSSSPAVFAHRISLAWPSPRQSAPQQGLLLTP